MTEYCHNDFWRGHTLSSIKNSKSVSVYDFSFLNLLLKSIFYQFKIIEFLKGATSLFFTHYSCVAVILFNTGLYMSALSTFSFGKLVFSLSVLFVFSVCSEIDIIFINFDNICIIIAYIAGVR